MLFAPNSGEINICVNIGRHLRFVCFEEGYACTKAEMSFPYFTVFCVFFKMGVACWDSSCGHGKNANFNTLLTATLGRKHP